MSAPTREEMRAELRKRLARRRKALSKARTRIWAWVRRRLTLLFGRPEANPVRGREPYERWPRWYAPPMGSEPATPAAIRARKLLQEADGAKLEELKNEVKARSAEAEAAFKRRWGMK